MNTETCRKCGGDVSEPVSNDTEYGGYNGIAGEYEYHTMSVYTCPHCGAVLFDSDGNEAPPMNTHPRPPAMALKLKRVSTMRQYRAFRRGVEVGKRLAEWGRV